MNTFFIADLHFGHKAIIEYENRPFNSVEDMDKSMIDNWNSVVEKNDKVFLLGDLSFYNNEKTEKLVRQLKGQKHLILGNHDKKSVEAYYKMGFHRVYDFPIIIDKLWMLSHRPMYVNKNMPYGNIFGHVHNNKTYADFSERHFCVSVERINYTPISFEKIKHIMNSCEK